MPGNQELHQRVYRKRQIEERLRTAALRSQDAQQERTWAIVSAHRDGLSIREIAKTTSLSPSRVHQILNSPDAHRIPVWLSQLREKGWPSEQNVSTEQSVESTIGDLLAIETSDEDSRARHRRRLTEPPPQPRRLSQREERAALRTAAGLQAE